MDCIQSTKDVGDFMRLRAYAKINLGLDILGKRSDGYHEVKMIMQTIQMYDLLEIKKKKTWVAFLLTLFLGPFGLFYTGKWVAALIMVLLELYQIFNYADNALSLNLMSFSHNIMYIVTIYFISLVLAPILTASYNIDLSKEMNVK